jgi:hypothetical protein
LLSVSQHAVPRHFEPAQHSIPAFPQAEHVPPVQSEPAVAQSLPLPTHLLVDGSQQSPAVVHLDPEQHVRPVAPHDEQVPATHVRPLPVHAAPPSAVQQGSPTPPQVAQVPVPVQTRALLPQVLPPQHGSPAPPQVVHVPLSQVSGPASPVGLHADVPAQQGSPPPPQRVHDPFALGQTVTPASPAAQAAPLLTHLAATGSQQPPGHVALAQQMSLEAPHAVQEPETHTEPFPWQSTPLPTQ